MTVEESTSVGNPAAEPIAVIGLAFKFPSGIQDTETFWQMIVNGSSGLAEIPQDRFNLGAFRPMGSSTSTNDLKGYFVSNDISAFDAPFFSITAEEATAMDPQHRILLETAYHAFENAGLPLEHISGSKTSVHVGCLSQDYRMINTRDLEHTAKYAATGQDMSILSGRLSWFFNLKGPSLSVETACSSSLVALDSACQLLRDGETEMGLVAGASLMHSPDFFIQLDNMGFLSPDNRCFSFDSRANGYARAEGFGVLIIKRLRDAIRDKNTIRAVIRASGTNSDGHTPGLTQPSGASQLALIKETYKKADLSMQPTRYCEAHGTGTVIGDPIEAHAIGAAFRSSRSSEDPIYIGGVKANLGHMEAASGMAGIIKTILVLEHGIVPPIADLQELNPNIDHEYYRLKFPTKSISWPSPGLRRASVNSFGFGGTNSHVILDDAYNFLTNHGLTGHHATKIISHALETRPTTELNGISGPVAVRAEDEIVDRFEPRKEMSRPYLLKISAADRDGVVRISKLLEGYPNRFNDAESKVNMCRSLAFTLNKRRSSLSWSSYALASSPKSVSSLSNLISTPQRAVNQPCVAFCFTGQGAQYAQMGFDLMRYSVFADSLARSESHLSRLGCQWSLKEELARDSSTTRVHAPDIAQPLSTAVQIALVDLLEYIGLRPALVVGHSSGEVAAAYCKGAICHKSAMKIAYFRGMSGADASNDPEMNGTMMAVGLGEAEAQTIIAEVSGSKQSHDNIYIGCINSPTSVTLSGDETSINRLKETLDMRQIFSRKLKVSCAYHSPLIAEAAHKFLPHAGPLEQRHPNSDKICMISYLDGKEVSSDRLRQLDYWVENMFSPVHFVKSINEIDQLAAVAKTGTKKLDLSHRRGLVITNILEVGPHSALRGPLREIVGGFKYATAEIQYHSALVRGSPALDVFLQSIGSLQCSGFDINVSYLNSDYEGQKTSPLVDLPAYPFIHSRQYWHESRRSRNERFRIEKPSELLGNATPDWNPYSPTWRNILSQSKSEWIKDHTINNVLLYPAAGMLAMAIEAANQYSRRSGNAKPSAFRLKDVEFIAPLTIPTNNSQVETQVHLRFCGNGAIKYDTWFEFTILACEGEQWKQTCKGFIQISNDRSDAPSIVSHRLDSSSDITSIPTDDFYDTILKAGYTYGPAFQRIGQVTCTPSGQANAVVNIYELPSDGGGQRGSLMMDRTHIIHPTTLDCILQVALANVLGKSPKGMSTMVPTKIKKLWLSSTGLNLSQSSSLFVSSWLDFLGYRGSEHTVAVTGAGGDTKLEVTGYELVRVSNGNSISGNQHQTDSHTCWQSNWELLPPAFDEVGTIGTSSANTRLEGVEIHVQNCPDKTLQLAETLRSTLLQSGDYASCKIIDAAQIASSKASSNLKIVLWDVDKPSILAELDEKAFLLLQKIVDCNNSILWLKTSDPHFPEFCSQQMVDGFSRVLRQEQNMANFATFLMNSRDIAGRAKAIVRVCKIIGGEKNLSYLPQTFRESGTGSLEVLKLKELSQATEIMETARSGTVSKTISWDVAVPLQLTIGQPGMLETLHYTKDDTYSLTHAGLLQDNEVEVEIKAVGISHRDYLVAHGAFNDNDIGNELSGVITRIGRDTEGHGYKPGQRVCGFAANGCRTYFRTQGKFLAEIPGNLSFPEAASIPFDFVTVWYSLRYVAHLAAGESVLIHDDSAAGGTTQAAIQVSRYLGAEVFVAVNTDEQRSLLAKRYGIEPNHIFNASDCLLSTRLKGFIGGGADVVINSRSGESLASAWESIAPFGRFIEIGLLTQPRNEILINGLQKNCSFSTVDIKEMFRTRPERTTTLLIEVLRLFEQRILQTVYKIHSFDIGRVTEAFKQTQSTKSPGKIVVEMGPSSQVEAVLDPEQKSSFNPNASYIIAGGLGGIGRDIARWMADKGAKHLILLSRSGPQSEAAKSLLASLKSIDVNCHTPSCDISNAQELRDILKSLIENKNIPPIKGCIQASMVLKSALFSSMTHSEWIESIAPKVSGSWNLHTVLPKDMDFFVLLSSVQGLLGSRTQSNYAAANCYLDALAQHRVSMGLKAVSLQLGLMDSDGYLSEHAEQKQTMLAQNTYLPLSRDDFHALMDFYCSADLPLLQPNEAQVAIGLQLLQTNSDLDPLGTDWGKDPMFASLRRINTVNVASKAKMSVASQLSAAKSAKDAARIVTLALAEKLASSLAGVDRPEDMDTGKSVQSYGVDSLQTMELRGWVLKLFRADVATFEILGASNLTALAQIVVERSSLRAN
ncbi:hypothetical protein TWF694_002591 [Orbilia ellipsospora]|uniref:Polyketide synthase n=1 Tax=Orbilia ellipsospora TaxID=2528407 RepID=A0AAV9X3N3_9PEZI